jgi:hypothetical protein
VKKASPGPKLTFKSDLGNIRNIENTNSRPTRFLGRIINRLNTFVPPPKKHMLNTAAIMDSRVLLENLCAKRYTAIAKRG